MGTGVAADYTGGAVTFIIICIVFFIIWLCDGNKSGIDEKIEKLANNTLEMTPEEFLEMRKASFNKHNSSYVSKKNFAGVYILFNQTKGMYYVGQGQKVFDRVNSHFAGRGNGDVYADYKYGDKFTIRMISLENSGFSTLNELERNTIAKYNSYYKGYNKTRGNKG